MSTLPEKYESDSKGSIDVADGLEKPQVTPAIDNAIDERKLLRRIDWHMLLLGILYAITLVDRVNISVARTVGMGAALKLDVGDRYSIVSCLYFVPYILLQLPSNSVLRYFGARNWLSFIVCSWGIVQLSMGFVTSWGYLALCRVLLGVFEAGFFPALVLMVTCWYKRFETQKRLAAFYLTSIFVGAFSAILTYGLSLIHGRGIAGWSWILIIEGVSTILLSIITYIFVTDFPENNNFLTAAETQFVLKRIEDDRGDSLPDALTLRKVLRHMGDWTMWAYALMFMCSTMPAYAIAYFISTILLGMGWNVEHALLLSAPPYVPAVVTSMFFAWISDKLRLRAIFIAVQTLMTIAGLLLIAYAHRSGVRYFGIFLANAGSLGCIPAIIAYSANNVVSQSKRSVSSAVIISFGGIGGIFATTVFREVDYPKYIPGIWTTLGCQFLVLALLAMTTVRHMRLNRKSMEGKLATPLEGQPGFLYTL